MFSTQLSTALRRWPRGADAIRVVDALTGGTPLMRAAEKHTRVTTSWLAALAASGLSDAPLGQVVVPVASVAIHLRPKGYADVTDDVLVDAGARVLLYMATRDIQALRDTLHPGNKVSLAFFRAMTGTTDPDVWLARAGADVAGFDAARQAEATARAEAARAAREQDQVARAQARIDDKLNQQVRFSALGESRVASVREMIDALVGAGYTRLLPRRSGMATEWWLADGQGSSTEIGGVAARDYAAKAIESATGIRPIVAELPKIEVKHVRLGQYDLRPSAADVLFKGKARPHYKGASEDTKSAAMDKLDRWATEYAANGSKVEGLYVIGYEQAGYPPKKWWVPVVALGS